MPKQRRVSGLVHSELGAIPKLSQPKVARGGGDESATCSGSVTQLVLGRAETVLEALQSNSQPECDDAIEYIQTMNQGVFTAAFLRGLRPKTLQSMAQCLGALPGHSYSQRQLLTKISALNLSKRELAESGLLRTIRHLVSRTNAATAKLTNEILSGQEARSASAWCLLKRLPPGATFAFCICIAV